MNTAAITAWLAAHKVPVLAAGGGGVALLALRARAKNKTGQSSVAVPVGTTTSPGYAITAGAPGAGPFDSSASDYDQALAPNLTALANQVQELNGSIDQLRNTIPVSSPTQPPAGSVIGSAGAASSGQAPSLPATTAQWTPPPGGPARLLAPNSPTQATNTAIASPQSGYLQYSYIGDDGKRYTENLPDTQGNRTALRLQGVTLR